MALAEKIHRLMNRGEEALYKLVLCINTLKTYINVSYYLHNKIVLGSFIIQKILKSYLIYSIVQTIKQLYKTRRIIP